LVGYHVKDLAPICLRGRTTTGPDGRFRIAGIEPASYGHYAMVFMAAGHLQRGDTFVSISEGREEDLDDVDLPVAADGTTASSLHRATIAGRLCGRDGVRNCIPLAGASVGYRLGADAEPKIITEVRADKEGRFAFPNVEPATFGRYRISVLAKGYSQRSEAVPGAYPGSTAWLDDVDLAGAAEGIESRDLLTATIAGTVCVRNTSGCAPVAGAEVALLDGQDQTQVLRSTRTDGKGRFGFSGLTPESRTFTVRYQAPDGSAMDTANVYGLDVGDTKHVECELRVR
jgi:5-hydroxyisourate hydrolase-like protein (transthyretin family)